MTVQSKLFVLDTSVVCLANPCHATGTLVWFIFGGWIKETLCMMIWKGRRWIWYCGPQSVEKHMPRVGPLLIAYLKQARWKITWTDRCTNRGIHVCKGRIQRCDPSQSWERHSTRSDKRPSRILVRSDLSEQWLSWFPCWLRLLRITHSRCTTLNLPGLLPCSLSQI